MNDIVKYSNSLLCLFLIVDLFRLIFDLWLIFDIFERWIIFVVLNLSEFGTSALLFLAAATSRSIHDYIFSDKNMQMTVGGRLL